MILLILTINNDGGVFLVMLIMMVLATVVDVILVIYFVKISKRSDFGAGDDSL